MILVLTLALVSTVVRQMVVMMEMRTTTVKEEVEMRSVAKMAELEGVEVVRVPVGRWGD